MATAVTRAREQLYENHIGGVIYDDRYRPLRRVRMGNGLHADLHEFEITPRDTALLIAYVGYQLLRFVLIGADWAVVMENRRLIAIGRMPQGEEWRLWPPIWALAALSGLSAALWSRIGWRGAVAFAAASLVSRVRPKTAGGATLRHDGTIVRQQGAPGRPSVTLGWIPIGRDATLEVGPNFCRTYIGEWRPEASGKGWTARKKAEQIGMQPQDAVLLPDYSMKKGEVEVTDHMRNFIDCVRSREIPRCGVDRAFEEAAVIAMSVEAYKRERKVRWNAEREEIV